MAVSALILLVCQMTNVLQILVLTHSAHHVQASTQITTVMDKLALLTTIVYKEPVSTTHVFHVKPMVLLVMKLAVL